MDKIEKLCLKIPNGFALTASPLPGRTWMVHQEGLKNHKEFSSMEEALVYLELSTHGSET